MGKQLEATQLNSCPVVWQALTNPDSAAIQTDNQQITYVQLHNCISDLSLQLMKLAMKNGDRLVCISPNSLSLVLLQLTCIRNGYIFCPLNPNFTEAEIQKRLTVLDTPFIWQENEKKGLALIFEQFSSKRIDDHLFIPKPIPIDQLTTISIIFTSGSSGEPKAVMHSYSNHYYSALGSQTVIPLGKNDKNLLSLPIFHISGYATVIRTLLAGATLQILSTKVSTTQLLRTQTTHLSLVNSQLIQLLKDPQFQADSLVIKHLLLGGSTFSVDTLQQTQARGFTYHLSYGSTEMASQIATSTNNETLNILPYRKIKIVNKEIQLAGETLFTGYYQRVEPKKNKFFPSSDLGEIHENTIKVIGRKDRQFISGGENIQPEEIEKVLLTFSEVSQAYVLPITDPIYGQRPIAFIKWESEDQPSQLNAFLKDKLVAFKRPLHFLTLPEQKGIKLDHKHLATLAIKLLP